MNLTINETTIEITSCARMRDTKRGFYLDIKIPQSNIGMNELYTLLDGNEDSIVVTDNDGKVNTYLGFKQLGSFACENGVYTISQVCTSEYEAQLSLAQSKIDEQESIINTMGQTIETQRAEIISQAEVIVAQGETIATQNEQLSALMEASVNQLDAIDSIMTEVLPIVAQEAAAMAVEQALVTIAENNKITENNMTEEA